GRPNAWHRPRLSRRQVRQDGRSAALDVPRPEPAVREAVRDGRSAHPPDRGLEQRPARGHRRADRRDLNHRSPPGSGRPFRLAGVSASIPPGTGPFESGASPIWPARKTNPLASITLENGSELAGSPGRAGTVRGMDRLLVTVPSPRV